MNSSALPTIGALFSAAFLIAAPTASADVVFTVRDRLATIEVAEVTTLYVDGQLVRSFRLDAEEGDITIPVHVDDAARHSFGLCGHILVRDFDGHIRKQVIKVTGTLEDVANRSYEAVASNDFTRFYLVDTTDSRPASTITNEDLPTCSPATS